ncbi:membrane lipoprotein lipid attachment site-containing protein [Anaerococcus jeddahensis]|uniref:membrane lipoprotein lipid attachment site-containing protein n=1 Tax=Anaerococcus jeddahensis TaxID=1673719 RepID=UPI0006726991|nr:membrane lipoprotein lipid attachment site-containing protein [Anaerococcus jeddahensis]
MKNKFIYLLFLALILSGCSKKSTRIIENDSNTNDEIISSDFSEKNSPDKTSIKSNNLEKNSAKKTEKKDNEDQKENLNLLTDTGSYSATLIDKSQADPRFGYIDNVKFENGYLVFTGVLNYNENLHEGSGDTVFDQGEYKFKLDENVKLFARSGLAEPEYMNQKEFMDYVNECMGSGLAFIINVEDSLAKEIIISS